ncbi:hypothetical protein [Mycolicibacterium sp.]|uniref:hypothetical protein n=1 Tax=Mycolicibacterium sp. TaxID=2320850 RepID=UPI0037C86AFA
MELFEQIRRDHRLGEVSIRELADRHKTHRAPYVKPLPTRPGAAQGLSGPGSAGDR